MPSYNNPEQLTKGLAAYVESSSVKLTCSYILVMEIQNR